MFRYEERDVFVSRSHLQDLVARLLTPPPLPLPLVFLHGELLGVSSHTKLGSPCIQYD